MDFVQVMGVAFAIIVTYFVGYSRGLSAERQTLQLPNRLPIDERPPEQRPSATTNLSPASEAAALAINFPFAIGERFSYLGVTMLCTRHTLPSEFIGVTTDPPAMLVAEYVAQGKVTVAAFAQREWPALLAEAGRSI